MTTTPRDGSDETVPLEPVPTGYGEDPTGGALEELARRGAREWERDMAAWEGDAEQLRRKRRSLAEVLWEAMQRGDRVSVTVVGHLFTGTLTAVRNDLALLDTAGASVAIHLRAVSAVSMERQESIGVVGDRTHGSLRSYLGMLEVEQSTVRILGADVDVTGRVTAVAVDHILLAAPGGSAWAVSLPILGAVMIAT